MSDPGVTQVDLSPAILLGPYGVTLACAAIQKITNQRPVVLALILSFLIAIVTLGDAAVVAYQRIDSSVVQWILFGIKELLLFLFGGFAVFCAALGMNVMSGSAKTLVAAMPPEQKRQWNTLWFD